jgi:hypothetical protein
MKSTCRFCTASLEISFCDLGTSPLSNAFVRPDRVALAEKFYPLHAYVCGRCFLVQLEQFESPERIFAKDYAYFSSYSDTWLAHAQNYARHAIEHFRLTSKSLAIEIASNDGYLLQYLKEGGIPVLGIEPAENVARVAEAKGIPTIVKFFGAALATELAQSQRNADVLIGNNVLAHVPDINDFVEGLRIALAPTGVVTLEFPHLLNLIKEVQFDTIYHEHFSYLSLLAVERIFREHGLSVFDVQQLPTHGGSLRIYVTHSSRAMPETEGLAAVRAAEQLAGLNDLDTYRRFAADVTRSKRRLLSFLIDAKEKGKRVVGYGAPAKGNTLLNYCGIRTDLLAYTVDRSPQKQGTFLPGTRIPVHTPDKIAETKPDYVLILPWNLRDEVTRQIAHVRSWGAKFVTAIPEVRVWD